MTKTKIDIQTHRHTYRYTYRLSLMVLGAALQQKYVVVGGSSSPFPTTHFIILKHVVVGDNFKSMYPPTVNFTNQGHTTTKNCPNLKQYKKLRMSSTYFLYG